MTEDLIIRPEQGYLYVARAGEAILDDGKNTEITAQVLTVCKESGTSRILLDIRCYEPPSLGAMFFRMRSYPAEVLNLRIAVLGSEANAEAAKFFVTTARNVGFKFECFADYDAAVQWLLS